VTFAKRVFVALNDSAVTALDFDVLVVLYWDQASNASARLPCRKVLCGGVVQNFLLFSDSKFNKVIPLAV